MRPFLSILTCVLLVMFGNIGIANAKPSFTWEPEIVDVTVDRGAEPTVVTVTATAERNQKNIRVVVVPTLRQYVVVSPSFINTVQRGQQITFELHISTPANLAVGLYDGTIHLEASGKNKSIPLPVSILNGEEVGVEGTTLSSIDERATLVVPQGTVSGDPLLFTMERIPIEDFAPFGNDVVIEPAFDFGPDGAVFDSPLTLTLQYSLADIPNGVVEEDLRIGFENSDGDAEILDGCSVNIVAQTISCPIFHFTRFTIIVPPDVVRPDPPTNVTADTSFGSPSEVLLDWDNPSADFSHAKIYRSGLEGVLGSVLLTDIKPVCLSGDVGCTEGPPYVDNMSVGLNCYTVRSVDFAGNESLNTDQVCREFDETLGGDVQYLAFLEGNPGVPGDDVVVNSSNSGDLPNSFRVSPIVSMGGITDGITVTAFVVGNTNYGIELVFGTLSVGTCTHVGQLVATTLTDPINGVVGRGLSLNQSQIDSLLAFCLPAGTPIADMYLREIRLNTGSGQITTIDAVAVGFGENVFPTDETPSPFTLGWALDGTFLAENITSRFGDLVDVECPLGTPKRHVGVDVSANAGDLVRAAEGGVIKVLETESVGNWGGWITIEHPTGPFTTVYLHIDPHPNLELGDTVIRGQLISTIADLSLLPGGNTTHFHFGMRTGSYTNTSNRGRLPQSPCNGDPEFPENFINPELLIFN